MYLDAAYIAKFYLNEFDSHRVRAVVGDATTLVSSKWSVPEAACAFHRHLREGHFTSMHFQAILEGFLDHVETGFWTLLPVSDSVIRRMTTLMSALPASIFLRAGDAIQLATALDAGEAEIWTNDRHMLAAAPHFGLVGRRA